MFSKTVLFMVCSCFILSSASAQDYSADAQRWLKEKSEANAKQYQQICGDVDARSIFTSAAPLKQQIRYVNDFIRDVDTYLAYVKPRLSRENFKRFQERCEQEIENMKMNVYAFCLNVDEKEYCDVAFKGEYLR